LEISYSGRKNQKSVAWIIAAIFLEAVVNHFIPWKDCFPKSVNPTFLWLTRALRDSEMGRCTALEFLT
jgi:hypothetical protein